MKTEQLLKLIEIFNDDKPAEPIVETKQARQDLPFEIGKSYLFRCVTHVDLGRVVDIKGEFLTLEDATWIADTGRWSNMLEEGTFQDESSELEPYPFGCIVNASAIVDCSPWPHALPRKQK